MNKTSVMIVEDQSMPRQLFEQFVNTSENYKLALSLSNASFAIMYLQTYHVDLILMDVITSQGSNGLLAAEDIKKHFPDIKIIIVTSMPECSYLESKRDWNRRFLVQRDQQRTYPQRHGPRHERRTRLS